MPTVWYALNAPQSTIDETPDHTLAGHLGLTAAGMEQALEAAQLKEGKGRRVPAHGASSLMLIEK